MSTDTYIDFSLPELGALVSTPKAWSAKYDELAARHPNSDDFYYPVRIGYVENFYLQAHDAYEVQSDRFDAFRRNLSGKTLASDMIPRICSDYAILWHAAQVEETNPYREDMLHPTDLVPELRSKIGWVMDVRVD